MSRCVGFGLRAPRALRRCTHEPRYMEKDPIRGNDSLRSFEEILRTAKEHNVTSKIAIASLEKHKKGHLRGHFPYQPKHPPISLSALQAGNTFVRIMLCAKSVVV